MSHGGNLEINPGGSAAGAVLLSLILAKGDLIAGTGASAAARLAVGADGQVLIADSTQADGMRWGAGGSGATVSIGTLAARPTAAVLGSGNLYYATDTFSLARSNGATYQEISIADLVTTKGDLAVGSAADTMVRLAAGADGSVLVADSSQASGLRWASSNAGVQVEAPVAFSYTPPAQTTTAGTPDDINGTYHSADLTGYTQVDFCVLTPTPYDAGVKIRPQYSPDGGTNWNYLESAGTGLEMAADVNDGSATVMRKSGYVALASAAQALVDLRFVVYGTTTATSKQHKAVLVFK